MKKTAIFFLSLLAFSSYGQEMTGVFFDPRDGQEYETIFIEMELEGGVKITKEWLGQNLNYDMDEGSYCYNNYEEYCDTFGRLYNWKAAVQACPAGWHLPTAEEINSLTKKHGGAKAAGGTFKEGGESGLNLIMAGFGEADGTFIDVGVNGYYWKQSVGGNGPGLLTIHNGVDYFTDDSIDATHRNSIRCVKD